MDGLKHKDIIDKEITNRYKGLLRVIKPIVNKDDLKQIREALNLAVKLCQDKKTLTGTPYVFHAISVSRIVVAEIGLSTPSIICALLHDLTDEPGFSIDEVKEQFGDQVVEILDGLSKISGIDTKKTHLQSENFRRLLLNLAADIRVILIKLADRLEYMRNLKGVKKEIQLQMASETYFLYAPLSHRLGLYNIKSEMEDLSMKYTDSKRYQLISRKLKETTISRNRFIREFSEPLKETLTKAGYTFDIKGRLKSIHSIWLKMKKQNLEFEEVFDLFAIRIILKSKPEREKADCWQVYSYVTDLYQPNPQRMRDWISVPKTNGYESLHTTVVGPGRKWVEVQIRTDRMNEIAEKGYAAHWKYKGLKTEKGIEEWLMRMREILETQEHESSDFIDQVKLNLYSEEVFVFTPKGDLKQLPAGSTVLDFAFEIHTEVGSTCVGGKVNNKNVSIRHVLQNGDHISILTAKNQKPKSDWLNFVVTSKARTKIKQVLNAEKYKLAEAGKEIAKRRFRNWKIPFSDENIKKLLNQYKLNTSQDLYYLIYIEKLDLAGIKSFLTKEEKEDVKPVIKQDDYPIKEKVRRDSTFDDFLVIDNKVKNLDYKLSKCCNPIFGDDVFGFVTISDGVKIHRINCPNAQQMMTKYPYRILNAKWTQSDGSSSFQTVIKVSGIDDIGLVSRISDVVAKDSKVIMRSISIESKDGMFEGVLKVLVSDINHLEGLLRRFLRIKGILKAVRYDEPTVE